MTEMLGSELDMTSESATQTRSGLAFFFPGQGAQAVGMGCDLHRQLASVRDLYAKAAAAVDFDLEALSFQGPAEELKRTDVSQPAILVSSLAALTALREQGSSEPAAVAGLSLGEYTALVAAGVLDLEDAIALVVARGRFMQECCEAEPSGMASILGASQELVETAVAAGSSSGIVVVANYNSPKQLVISGDEKGLAAACEAAKAAGARRVTPLAVAGAYHSPLMAPAGERLAKTLESVDLRAPRIPYVSNVTANFENDPAKIRELLVKQVSSPVRWRESVERLVGAGIKRVIELGPGGVLSGLCRQIDRSLEARSAQSFEDVCSAADSARAANGE